MTIVRDVLNQKRHVYKPNTGKINRHKHLFLSTWFQCFRLTSLSIIALLLPNRSHTSLLFLVTLTFILSRTLTTLSSNGLRNLFILFLHCSVYYTDQRYVWATQRHTCQFIWPLYADHLKIKKNRVLLNRAPSSTQLHPPPPSSFQPPPSSFQPPPSSLQYPQQYLNQNIARNWAISPNLGQKFKNCPFWQKIGTHGILEVVIPNPDLDFWNSDTKIHF